MSSQEHEVHLANCENYLSQGDIFHIDLVAPMADPEKRIFRTVDGKHASEINADGSEGRIFSYDELMNVIADLPPQQRLLPFQRTSEGKPEMVLVYADLLRYFIILSQTCDISGVDSPANPMCVIAPVVTLAQHCQSLKKLPYNDPKTNQKSYIELNITDYISERFDSSFRDRIFDDLAFPKYLREKLPIWRSKANNVDRQLIGGIKNSLVLMIENKPLYIYYIATDSNHRVPESYVDFCRVYTISTSIIENLKDKRLAVLKTPYREEFARKFADYYARIATPWPMPREPI